MYPITTSSGRTFHAGPEDSILEAALRHGVVLDHSCRSGRCGSCKGRVRAGQTAASSDEVGLSAAERAQGFVLTCLRRACSSVELEIEDFGDVSLPEAKTLPCRIASINRPTPSVLRVLLLLPPSAVLDFLPGQYVDVIGANGVRRSYSVANAPRVDRQIELHVREVKNGAMSRYWFQQAKVNDLLRLRGPLGTFFLRSQAGKDLILLATGTGIAPVKAILESLPALSADARPRTVTVYWGGRYPEDLYWSPVVPTAVPEFEFVPVLSRADRSWAGERGYVQDVLMRKSPNLNNALVYASGSGAMIQEARLALRLAGLSERFFFSDAFVCSASN